MQLLKYVKELIKNHLNFFPDDLIISEAVENCWKS